MEIGILIAAVAALFVFLKKEPDSPFYPTAEAIEAGPTSNPQSYADVADEYGYGSVIQYPVDESGDAYALYSDVADEYGYSSTVVYQGEQDMTQANVAAFLVMIQIAEGTYGPDAYRTMFGYRYFDSFADHPREAAKQYFTDLKGNRNWTDASGAYQTISTTWDRVAKKLGLTDFSPESQDAAAVELIRERGALGDVWAGRFDVAVSKVSGEWASLPGSRANQGKRTIEFVRSAYVNAGGSLA